MIDSEVLSQAKTLINPSPAGGWTASLPIMKRILSGVLTSAGSRKSRAVGVSTFDRIH
jgi:hypothetical protein